MNIFFFIALSLGSFIVIQPNLNRLIAEQHGLAMAAFINGLMLFLASSLLIFFIWHLGDKANTTLQIKANEAFKAWYILPGLMGLTLVMVVPLTMKNIGAFSTVIAMLAGQIATSFWLDSFINHQPISLARVIGLIMALVGAYLSFK